MSETFLGISEVAWVAIQAITAGMGTIVAGIGLYYLIAYTKYTKRMMELQLETRRAEVSPVFTLSEIGGAPGMLQLPADAGGEIPPSRTISLKLRNIGKAPALRIRGWHREVDSSFKLDETKLLPQNPADEESYSFMFEVLAGESVSMSYQRVANGKYNLMIFECEDTGGTRHQFQVILIPRPAAIDPWVMVHGWGEVPSTYRRTE